MKENDIDEIIQWHDSFTETVKQFSMSAEEQIQKLKGTVVTDEIASDFTEIGMLYAQKLLHNGWITQEQFNIVLSIDEMLEEMTQNKELWNNDALSGAAEWEICRKKGKDLLQTLEI